MNTDKLVNDIHSLLKLLQTDIADDYFACEMDEGLNSPSIQVTIACNDDMTDFRYQTGDNSFTGACYSLPHWAVGTIYREDDSETLLDIAKDYVNQLVELVPDSVYESEAVIEWS